MITTRPTNWPDSLFTCWPLLFAGEAPLQGEIAKTKADMVLARDKHQKETCNETCAQTIFTICDAELSITGKEGNATANGE